jgi:hypothetical protein
MWGRLKNNFMPRKFGIVTIELIALQWLLQALGAYPDHYQPSGAQ